jgi:hypothetical protein
MRLCRVDCCARVVPEGTKLRGRLGSYCAVVELSCGWSAHQHAEWPDWLLGAVALPSRRSLRSPSACSMCTQHPPCSMVQCSTVSLLSTAGQVFLSLCSRLRLLYQCDTASAVNF